MQIRGGQREGDLIDPAIRINEDLPTRRIESALDALAASFLVQKANLGF